MEKFNGNVVLPRSIGVDTLERDSPGSLARAPIYREVKNKKNIFQILEIL